MKIGIVCYPTYGGSGVVATELGKALAEQGHQVHFITYSQPVRLGSFAKNISFHEVNVSNYPLFDYAPYELVLSSKLVDVVKYENLDLLHVHYAIPHASAAYMAQQILKDQGIDIPFITTLHGTDITLVGKDPSFESAITFAINKSTAVTAVSESLKQDTLASFNVKKEINVIPNFICMDQVAVPDQNMREFYAPNGEKIIMHISNFRPVKRVGDVIEVFDKIRKETPAKLLLIGDGPERTVIERKCKEKGICADVKFLGKMRSTAEVLAIADLFLLPSEFESFGLVALEAFAQGVPVISTNTGGLPEVNLHGFSGLTSDVGNCDEMASNALHIMDEENHQGFRSNAIQQARKFDIKQILPVYEAHYKKVLEEKG